MQVGQHTPTTPASRPAPGYAATPAAGAAQQQQAAGSTLQQPGAATEVEQVAVLGYN